jgi:predicted phosphoribosyltransferase
MTRIHEREDMRNRRQVFGDRSEAGKVLGRMLSASCRDDLNAIVLGIPMGGVPVAFEIAAALQLPMDLVIVRKIQIPGNTEAGFGAMTREGDVLLNGPLIEELGLGKADVERQSAAVRSELENRDRRLRGGRPFPELEGKTAILVDDGLASGFSMKAAVRMVRKRRASKILIAVPTAPMRIVEALADSVDEIYCANIREVLSFAVADAYENWTHLSESAVLALLSRKARAPA